MQVFRSLEDDHSQRAVWGRVFVPTMGALHEGHASLIRRAVQISGPKGSAPGCIVSLFVNPTQFNERADYERYPRTEEADLALCERAGASAVFAPAAEYIYPPGNPPVVPPLPAVATEPGLEDAHRPGHFAGVCQVVLRLFSLVRPTAAVFGEKDWQQLQVIRAMSAAAGLPIRIVPGPTAREADGLAMSSRNRFLSPQDRMTALAIFEALTRARSESTVTGGERVMASALRERGIVPEYAVIRDAETLRPLTTSSREGRALIAARVGAVRLIDNTPWNLPESAGAGAKT